MFDAVKSYFLSIEKPPQVQLKFLENLLSETYLYFLHSQWVVFDTGIRKIKTEKNSVIEIISILDETMKSLVSKKEEQFLSLSVKSQLQREEISSTMYGKLKSEVKEFYDTIVKYLSMWSSSFSELKVFSWMLLKNVSEWSELEKICIYLKEKKVQIDDSQLSEEFQKLKVYLAEATKENEWILKPAHAKWVHCFQSETGTSTVSSQLLICCKYLFAISMSNGSSA